MARIKKMLSFLLSDFDLTVKIIKTELLLYTEILKFVNRYLVIEIIINNRLNNDTIVSIRHSSLSLASY